MLVYLLVNLCITLLVLAIMPAGVRSTSDPWKVAMFLSVFGLPYLILVLVLGCMVGTLMFVLGIFASLRGEQ